VLKGKALRHIPELVALSYSSQLGCAHLHPKGYNHQQLLKRYCVGTETVTFGFPEGSLRHRHDEVGTRLKI
jgi:hypothetical protein